MKQITFNTIARGASNKSLKEAVVAATTTVKVVDNAGEPVVDKAGKPVLKVRIDGDYANVAAKELKRRGNCRLRRAKMPKHGEVRDAA